MEAFVVSTDATAIVNALTVDVEDYFQVSALAPHFPREQWADVECRVERNIDKILAMLSDAQATATFFVLGWIAERYPHLVRNIVSQGHEIASHGCDHRRVTEFDPRGFEADLRDSKRLLEGISGHPVLGYRAPSFSIGLENQWAFDCLRSAGFRYSSSVYPIRHDHYGVPSGERLPYEVRTGLLEIPIATVRRFRTNFPAGGGGYFRFLPYRASKWLIGSINRDENRSAVFYFHPWEIDPRQPVVRNASAKTRFRHYVNLDKTESRLRQLLVDFRWGRMDHVFLSNSR
jgi:polysaccharide deacetylase family protein (PEP-CTERM system associated)